RERCAPRESGAGAVFPLLLTLPPAVARDNHDVVLFDNEVVRGVFRLSGVARDHRAALVAVLALNLLNLRLNELPAALLVFQQAANLPGPLPLFLELVANDQDFQPRQAVDLELEDGIGLIGIEL